MYDNDENDLSDYEYLNQEAINCVLNMINEHEKINLKELKELKVSDLKPNTYVLLCHKCIYYDVPGIVDMFCYGLKDNNENYYYMLTSKYLGR